MTKNLSWRLSKLPTPDEVRELVKDKIITQEEAREILFKSFDEQDSQIKDAKKIKLEEEIKILRNLVEKLSQNNYQRIVDVITVEKPIYVDKDWYQPYKYWCTNATSALNTNSVTSEMTTACSAFNSIL